VQIAGGLDAREDAVHGYRPGWKRSVERVFIKERGQRVKRQQKEKL
jgi:hypothetical protein